MFYVLRGPRWPQDGHMMAQERPRTSQRAPETPPETPQDGPQIFTIIDLGHPLAPQGSRKPSETLNPSKKYPKLAATQLRCLLLEA